MTFLLFSKRASKAQFFSQQLTIMTKSMQFKKFLICDFLLERLLQYSNSRIELLCKLIRKMEINQQQRLNQGEQVKGLPVKHQIRSYVSNFFRIRRFHQEKNKLTTLSVLSLKYLLPFILVLKILPLSQEATFVPLLKCLLSQYFLPFYAIIMFNKFLIIITLYAFYQEVTSQSPFTTQLIRLFKSKLRILIEIDYHISMGLLSFGLLENLANFILSFGLYIFACICLQNYMNKEDLFYCSSCRANTYFRLLLTAGYIIAALVTHDGGNSGGLKAAVSIYNAVMIAWYYQQGSQLYPSDIMNKGLLGFMSLLIATNLLIIEKEFMGGSSSISQFLTKVVISFSVILFTSYIIIQNKIEGESNRKRQNIRDIKDFFNNLYIKESNAQKVAFIYAHIQMHQQNCQNVSCQLHSFNLFDQRITMGADFWGICHIIKSYFRCLYQSQLLTTADDNSLIQYMEYLYSQRNANQYKMALTLSKISIQNVDIFNLPALCDLKKNVQRLFKNKMNELYQGKLHFEETLSFDENFRDIEKQISYLAKSNMKIYKHLQQNEIDLNVVFGIIRDNLEIQKLLNKSWLSVSSNIKHQKHLTMAYFYYKQLIKNERLTRKDMLLMNIEDAKAMHEQSIFLSEGNYFNPAILFHKETMIFTCTLLNEKLLFKDINYNFEFYLGFSREELVLSSLDNIFNDDLKQVHQASFSAWMNSNLKSTFINQSFQFKKTECVTKDKDVLPVLKYFKSYLNNESQLEFVCMLKVNRKEAIGTSNKIDEARESTEYVSKEDYGVFINFKYNNSIDLSNQNAIFIKDKQFEPNQSSSDISNIKIILSIFFTLIIVSLVAFHVLTVSDAYKLQDYSQQYITFMQCYRFPMILGNSYLQSILGIGNQTKIASQINQWRNSFAALTSSSIILKTLYDPKINQPQEYYPYQSGRLNLNYSEHVDQIQLYYMVASSIASLRAPIDPNSEDFQIFDKFITPAYDDMLNATKLRFHEQFIDYINSIIKNQIFIDIMQSSIAFIFIIIMIYRIRVFMVKMKLISDAIVYFKKEDLERIRDYWVQAHHNFQEVFAKYRNVSYSKDKQIRNNQKKTDKVQNQEQFMNRLNKKIIQSRHFRNLNNISISSIIIGAIIIAASLSGTQVSRILRLNYLIYFENEGYLFLRYFPTATVVGYGCLSKYRSILNPEIVFNPRRYDTTLTAMKLVGQFTYIPEVKDQNSLYFKKQRNYFFGNPCTYNPTVISNIGVSIAACQSIINGSFSRGLTSYMREGSLLADSFINGEVNLSPARLVEFSQSVSVLSGYILDAISSWGTEFSSNLIELVSQQAIFTSINIAVVTLVFVCLFYVYLINLLQNEYEFYRYMFMKMIPEYVLRTDKVARQTFINFNILE